MAAQVHDIQLLTEVQQFLYHEATLLDQRRYHEWMDLLTDDLHYWMPLRRTVLMKDTARYETGLPNEQSYFDDDKAMIKQRVAKLDTGFSWSEDPPSRTRHMVNNVQIREVKDTPDGQEVTVDVYFFCYRSRLNSKVGSDTDFWVGTRQDTLRNTGGEWKIARRHIFIDEAVLQSQNISNFL